MATPNKGYTDQATGSNAGTWGQVLNDEALDYIDQNLGGITSKSLTNVNVTLTAAESRTAILRLTGTLTDAVQITTECIGFVFVENLCTGNFAVTIRNNISATTVQVLKGTRQLVISDGTNGCRLGVSMEFPSGTVQTFRQSSAPTGWTKDTVNYNNSAFRCVTGAVSNGGSLDFTSAFASRTIEQANLPNINLTAQSAGAKNTTLYWDETVVQGGSTQPRVTNISWSAGAFNTTGLTADNHTHNVPLGGSGTPMDFAVKYVDLIIATKDAT